MLALTYIAEWYRPIDSPARVLEEMERAARKSCFLASSQVRLAEIQAANTALGEAEVPMGGTLTATESRRMVSSWHPDLLERWLDGLRKAGLPE